MGARKIKAATTITEYPRDQVPLKDLRVDPAKFQTRVNTDMETVSKYAARYVDGSPFPDVLVFLIAGVYWLVDGFHRVAAAERLGLKTITARIREATPDELLGADEQGFLAGLAMNLAEITAKGYGADDRKHAAEMMIRNGEFRTWSNTEIGRRCNVTTNVVVTIRVALKEHEGIPIPGKVKRFKDGKWTGRWRTTQLSHTMGTPTIFQDKYGIHRMRIGGVVKNLGKDRAAAETARDILVREREATRISLSSNSEFTMWLSARRVHAVNSARGHVPGFLKIDNVRVVLVPGDDLAALFVALGKFHDLRERDPMGPVILCGYFDDLKGAAGSFVARIRSYRNPVPMLSPLDVVARFAPASDAPGGEGDR